MKKVKNSKRSEREACLTTYVSREDHELLKLLVNLRNTNVAQFLKEYISGELDKNRENLELIKMAIDDINSKENNIVAINKIA